MFPINEWVNFTLQRTYTQQCGYVCASLCWPGKCMIETIPLRNLDTATSFWCVWAGVGGKSV